MPAGINLRPLGDTTYQAQNLLTYETRLEGRKKYNAHLDQEIEVIYAQQD